MKAQQFVPDSVVEQRKKDAEEEAEKRGHRIGVWTLFTLDKESRWRGACLNKGCAAMVSVNPTPNGIAAGVSAFLTTCPYKRRR